MLSHSISLRAQSANPGLPTFSSPLLPTHPVYLSSSKPDVHSVPFALILRLLCLNQTRLVILPTLWRDVSRLAGQPFLSSSMPEKLFWSSPPLAHHMGGGLSRARLDISPPVPYRAKGLSVRPILSDLRIAF